MRASNKVMRPSKAFLITWHLNGNPKDDINLAAGSIPAEDAAHARPEMLYLRS